jgi:ATP-dependent helicase HrpB
MLSVLPTLPVNSCLPELLAALTNGNAVLVAPPGAGKTTLEPLALLDAAWRGDGTILMLEPRRLAARAAATRMARLLGEEVGQRVGYRTRLDRAVSAATRIEVVTQGLLVRRMQSDPGLDGVAAVLLDEVHERSLDADLALAFCLDLQRNLRPELRLLAMSATAEAERLAALLGGPVIRSEGRQYPVEIEYSRDISHPRELPEAMAAGVRRALQAAEGGDVLAFLPGMAEIRRTEALLQDCGALILALHGDLPAAGQDRALRPAEGRRVVLATSIAETSLTVPGVRVVVDGGWRRAPQLDPGTGLSRLTTQRISVAAAAQRAGRAGREAPGRAIRLWSTAQQRGLVAFEKPEILRSELSGLLLDCAAWGEDPGDLPFPDPPPPGPLAAARALLGLLGAIDGAGRITGTGRRMAQLGAHPRLAAMMLAAQTPGEAALAADIAALLEERDPFRGPISTRPADISLRLAALDGRDPQADRGAVARIRQAAGQYRKRLDLSAAVGVAGAAGAAGAAGDPAKLIAAGFPDRIAQGRGEAGSFRLAGGGGARLPPNDRLARAKFLAVAALEMQASARIRLAAPLDPADLTGVESVETTFDPLTGQVVARRRRRLGALVLEDHTETVDPGQAAALLAEIAGQNIGALPWTDADRQLQARVALMHHLEPQTWPDLSDAALAARVAEWLPPALTGLSKLAALDVGSALRAHLVYPLDRRLETELPTELALPGGRAKVDYLQPLPVAAARAQAFYGLTNTPVLAGGRVKLQLALLSPAGRPIAVTSDLAGFWQGAWREVRREMRGRYPKHNWPENPDGPMPPG